MSDIRDFFQGASNAAASNVSAPIDGIAWLLRKAGMDIQNPVGGSDWMRAKGLTAEPTNRMAGLLGESFGGVAPIFAAAKAPQIANGLLKMGENAAIPNNLNKQAGVIRIGPLRDSLNSAKKYRIKEVKNVADEIEAGWSEAGENFNNISKKIPKGLLDADGDFTQEGLNLYNKLQSEMAFSEAQKMVPKASLDIVGNPQTAAAYAKWYAEHKGVPVYQPGGSSLSSSTYLPVGSENASNALTMRFSTHVLPEHYPNNASFEFGNFEGGKNKLSDIRSFINSLKNK